MGGEAQKAAAELRLELLRAVPQAVVGREEIQIIRALRPACWRSIWTWGLQMRKSVGDGEGRFGRNSRCSRR